MTSGGSRSHQSAQQRNFLIFYPCFPHPVLGPRHPPLSGGKVQSQPTEKPLAAVPGAFPEQPGWDGALRRRRGISRRSPCCNSSWMESGRLGHQSQQFDHRVRRPSAAWGPSPSGKLPCSFVRSGPPHRPGYGSVRRVATRPGLRPVQPSMRRHALRCRR